MITNWIGTARQILVILAIELREVEDLLIVTLFKSRESVVNGVVLSFDTFQFRAKLFEYKAPAHYAFCIKKFIGYIFVISVDRNLVS